MALRLLNLQFPIQIYSKRGLKCFSVCFRRNFSNHDGKTHKQCTESAPRPTDVKSEFGLNWLNIRAGIFGPDDDRMMLPGDIGHTSQLKAFTSVEEAEMEKFSKSAEALNEALDLLMSQQESRLEDIRQMQIKHSDMNEHSSFNSKSSESLLECKIQDCPSLLRKDFQTLFPDIDLRNQRIFVVTFCQKTKNDMSSWSEAMEEEREELMEHFVECSDHICDTLRSSGHWADFIDPGSGRPFSGAFTNATLFETDERYRHFGFQIEDLGCCKIISHRLWGTNIFVGAMFTTAPIDAVKQALGPLNSSVDV